MVLGNSEAIRMAVQEGLGLGFVSTMVAGESVEAGTLAIVPIEGIEITKTLYMIRSTEIPGTSGGSAFWDYVFAPENEEILARPARMATGGKAGKG